MPKSNPGGITDPSLGNLTVLCAAAMVLFLVAPRTSPGVLGLLALTLGLAGGFAGGLAAGLTAGVTGLVPRLLLLLALWGLISTAWAAERGEAVNKSFLLAALVFVATWATNVVWRVRPDVSGQLGKVAVIAFSAGLAYLLVEEISDHRIKRAVFTVLPFALPGIKHFAEAPEGVIVAGYISNRNMAAMVLALWPMLLIAWLGLGRQHRVIYIALLALVAAAMLSMSKHETSLIALVLSTTVLALCLVRPRIGLAAVAVGWILATMLVVPMASWAAHGARLHEAAWLPNSARHRIVLWAYTAEQVAQRPVHGVGAASTKRIDQMRGPKVDNFPGTKYQWRSGPHAHNVYLQTWYEIGVIGAALLCAAGLALVFSLARLPAAAMPIGAATFTAAATIAAFSWGMWQAWFLAIFAVAAVLMGLAARIAGSAEAEAPAARTSAVPAPVE